MQARRSRSTRGSAGRLLAWTALPAVVACATPGATFRSGVGDAFPQHPPFYAGEAPGGGGAATGRLPVAYQRGATQVPLFDPAVTDDLAALLGDMDAYLDSLALAGGVGAGDRVPAVTDETVALPPDVAFGCVTRPGADDDECDLDGDETLGREATRMRLAVGRPSPAWTEQVDRILSGEGLERVLVITLEVGWYPVRQRGLLGHKEVELGTGHTASLPWLTSLEAPVAVLQLTGALVGPGGKALRIGAEGLVARRTALALSAVGAQALVTEAEVRDLRAARREDVPGEPLAWQVGLRNLVAGLLGSGTR